MPAQLVAITEGPNILLDKPILLVGRHQECDIQIPSRKVSRRHCCIAQVNDHLMVRDLCSTNGIRINGERINEGELHSGDELTIGNFRYQVAWSGQPIPVVPPPRPDHARPEQVKLEPRRALPALPASLRDRDPLESCEEPVALDEPGLLPNVPLAPLLPTNAAAPAPPGQAPAVQPPVVQPPVNQPPANQPPANQPPANQPPANQPPANQLAPEPPPGHLPPVQQSMSIPENLDLAPISDSQPPPQK